MNDLNLPEQPETTLEAALTDFPLAPLPPRFVEQVMAQVQRYPRFQPEPFRLQFLDFALPAFWATFAMLLLALVSWSSGQWQMEWLPAWPAQLAQISTLLQGQWGQVGVFVVLIEVMGGVVICATLWQDRSGL